MNRGFTLIELAIVLFIIALMTHLAVREAGKIRDSKQASAAESQFDEIAAAVYDEAGGEPSGFLADMGRLPRSAAQNADAPEVFSPCELWLRGDLPPFRLREASGDGYCGEAPEDPAVKIPCGWRGPYLRLPAGGDTLRDPWGNPFVSKDAAGFCRILDCGGGEIAEAGVALGALRHFGSDGLPDNRKRPARFDQADRTFDIAPSNAATCVVQVLFTDADGMYAAGVVSRLDRYFICEGLVTGAVAEVSGFGCVVTNPAPGVCCFRAETPSGVRYRRLALRPGTNPDFLFRIE